MDTIGIKVAHRISSAGFYCAPCRIRFYRRGETLYALPRFFSSRGSQTARITQENNVRESTGVRICFEALRCVGRVKELQTGATTACYFFGFQGLRRSTTTFQLFSFRHIRTQLLVSDVASTASPYVKPISPDPET